MTKYRYTVVSDEYVGALTRLRKTGRKVIRPAQTLFNPKLTLFGLSVDDCEGIAELDVGGEYLDKWGDLWERIQ